MKILRWHYEMRILQLVLWVQTILRSKFWSDLKIIYMKYYVHPLTLRENVRHSNLWQKDDKSFPQYQHSIPINQNVTWFSFYFSPIEGLMDQRWNKNPCHCSLQKRTLNHKFFPHHHWFDYQEGLEDFLQRKVDEAVDEKLEALWRRSM